MRSSVPGEGGSHQEVHLGRQLPYTPQQQLQHLELLTSDDDPTRAPDHVTRASAGWRRRRLLLLPALLVQPIHQHDHSVPALQREVRLLGLLLRLGHGGGDAGQGRGSGHGGGDAGQGGGSGHGGCDKWLATTHSANISMHDIAKLSFYCFMTHSVIVTVL